MARRKRPYYRHYANGLNVAQGQIIKYARKQGGNSHTYFLKALVSAQLTDNINLGLFEILNPTTYLMTAATAVSSNIELLPGEKLIVSETGEVIENNSQVATTYNALKTVRRVSGKYASLVFQSGKNNMQEIHLNNGFQAQKIEVTTNTTVATEEFFIEVLNAPNNFTGFVKVINDTLFENIRAAYPTVSVPNPRITMSYPNGLAVTATYDSGMSYENDGALNDFFYLYFERAGANLVITKYPTNTTPNGI